MLLLRRPKAGFCSAALSLWRELGGRQIAACSAVLHRKWKWHVQPQLEPCWRPAHMCPGLRKCSHRGTLFAFSRGALASPIQGKFLHLFLGSRFPQPHQQRGTGTLHTCGAAPSFDFSWETFLPLRTPRRMTRLLDTSWDRIPCSQDLLRTDGRGEAPKPPCWLLTFSSPPSLLPLPIPRRPGTDKNGFCPSLRL